MTAQPVEPLPQELVRDAAAEELGRINAAVIERLIREGKPVPGQPTSP